jgi:hypothetical protein
MGPQVEPGTYAKPIAPNDIAPTVALILGLGKLNGSSGGVLSDTLK